MFCRAGPYANRSKEGRKCGITTTLGAIGLIYALIEFETMKLNICIAGATGWVGKPLCQAVAATDDLSLVGAVSPG